MPSRGDAADDPAIWIHPAAPERSLVVGTDKRSGLLAFDLGGNQVQYLPAGNLNNVDLRTGAWGRDDLTIGVASASGESKIAKRNDPVVAEPYGPETSGVRVGGQSGSFFLGQAMGHHDRLAGFIEKRRRPVCASKARAEYSSYAAEQEGPERSGHGVDDAPVAGDEPPESARPDQTEGLVDRNFHG